MIRICTLAIAVSLLLGLSGCVAILQETAIQRDEVGDIDVSTVICASGRNSAPQEGQEPRPCPAGNSGAAAGSGDFQLLLGYRIPAGITAPESIAAEEGTITLFSSPSHAAELNRIAPIPEGAGQRWVGYISPSFSYGAAAEHVTATLRSRFGLVRGPDGSPWVGPFRYRTVVGYRDTAGDPGRAVGCGTTMAEISKDGTTVCVDSPTPDEVATDFVIPTRDLGVLSGPRDSVGRGASAPMTFTVAYSGGRASPSFSLSATTSIPGGTAVPAVRSITPSASGDTGVAVTVTAPASVPPGDYDVTLVAKLPNGQRRAATGTVSVTGPSVVDRTPPEVNIRVRSLPRIARARQVGVAPEVACSESCLLTAALRMSAAEGRRLQIPVPRGQTYVTVGRTAERVTAAGRRNLRVRLLQAVRPKLGRTSHVSLTYRVVARDIAGNSRVRSVRFSLRR